MGGMGSGNWFRLDSKRTVEDSLVFSVRHVSTFILREHAGSLAWTSSRQQHRASVDYKMMVDNGYPVLMLNYRWRDVESVAMRVDFDTTKTAWGGLRWWFLCPLVKNGATCGRRIGKLYLPPGSKYFGCRSCHDLTYRSCQAAHQTARFMAALGIADTTGLGKLGLLTQE